MLTNRNDLCGIGSIQREQITRFTSIRISAVPLMVNLPSVTEIADTYTEHERIEKQGDIVNVLTWQKSIL